MSNYQTFELDIKPSLLTVYDKVQNQSTKQVGFELFKSLISKHLQSQQEMNYIIQQLSEYVSSLDSKQKDTAIKLLSFVFYNNNPNNKSMYYIYISPILSILQTLIKDTFSSLFPSIANCYAEIVQYTMRTDLESSLNTMDTEEKKSYEILQGFCIYNMKYEEKANKICGSLCLTKLVENCPIVLQNNYLKFIWENIINFIDKKSFCAKYELLNCLISLILGAETLFKPYANVTLFKVMEFLTDNDWLKRKLALNVIYTIAFYCKEEIIPLKSHILSFLKLLKTDKVKEVREASISILNILVDKEESKENEERVNTQGGVSKNENKTKNYKKKDIVKKPSTSDSNEKRSITPIRSTTPNRTNNKKRNDEYSDNINNNVKNTVNRKEDNKFVNEKMVIKPNPNHSIFKCQPNQEFFKKAKKQPDIIVYDKKVNQNAEENTNMDVEEQIDNNEYQIENENKEEMNVNSNEKMINIDEDNKEIQNEHQPTFNNKTAKFNDNILDNNQEENTPIRNKISNKQNQSPQKQSQAASLINSLLSQMNSLSSKQLVLIDTITSIQNETQSQFDSLNKKITSLENTVDTLSSQLKVLKTTATIPQPQNDINFQFKQALNSESQTPLLSLISKTSINQLKNVDIVLIEDSIIRLITLLSKGENTKVIISFYKAILLALRLPLRMIIIQNIKDILEYITTSNLNGNYQISEEEMIDVSIILSSLNSNTQKMGY